MQNVGHVTKCIALYDVKKFKKSINDAMNDSDFDINEVIDEYGKTLLSFTIHHMSNNPYWIQSAFGMIEHLLENGADPNACGEKFSLVGKFNALDDCAFQLVDLLLKYNLDINRKNQIDSITPLYEYIALHGFSPIGYYTSSRNLRQSITFMTSPAANDNIAMLLERGADPNMMIKNNETPFHAACHRMSSFKLLECFLDHGADIHMKDSNDETCYDILKKSAWRYDAADQMKLMKLLMQEKQ